MKLVKSLIAPKVTLNIASVARSAPPPSHMTKESRKITGEPIDELTAIIPDMKTATQNPISEIGEEKMAGR
jgi:hypothetical protein